MAENLLTFDIEDWYHANFDGVDLAGYKGTSSHFRANMDLLLQLCSDTGCKATFFILGCIGEDYPDVVKAIARAGHEIASHGCSHQLAYKQNVEDFRADVKKSVEILQALTGEKVLGYRAPSWSIVESNLHYLEALESLGMKYDASIFPVKTFLYGIPNAPTAIHKPCVNGRELDLYEVPMSVMKVLGKNIGFSGGFYFRLFPQWLIKRAIRAANNQGRSAIVYLHPRELDAAERRLSLPLLESFIQYYNVGNNRSKLENVLRSFHFTSIAKRLEAMEQEKGEKKLSEGIS